MPMEDMLEMLKGCCRRELQYLRMAQYLHLVPQTFYRVMWGGIAALDRTGLIDYYGGEILHGAGSGDVSPRQTENERRKP